MVADNLSIAGPIGSYRTPREIIKLLHQKCPGKSVPMVLHGFNTARKIGVLFVTDLAIRNLFTLANILKPRFAWFGYLSVSQLSSETFNVFPSSPGSRFRWLLSYVDAAQRHFKTGLDKYEEHRGTSEKSQTIAKQFLCAPARGFLHPI